MLQNRARKRGQLTEENKIAQIKDKGKLSPLNSVPKSQLYPWALWESISPPHILEFSVITSERDAVSQMGMNYDLHLHHVLLLRKESYCEQK